MNRRGILKGLAAALAGDAALTADLKAAGPVAVANNAPSPDAALSQFLSGYARTGDQTLADAAALHRRAVLQIT